MTPDSLHDFFLASAGAAGALVGLLFVAVSVSRERLEDATGGAVSRIRAQAALSSFSNALAVSLFSLIPGVSLGAISVTVGTIGLLFICASLLTLRHEVAFAHLRDLARLRDLSFLALFGAVCGSQVVVGLQYRGVHDLSDAKWLAIVVVVCFLAGVQRSWELIGGPGIGLRREVFEIARERYEEAERHNPPDATDTRRPEAPAPPPTS